MRAGTRHRTVAGPAGRRPTSLRLTGPARASLTFLALLAFAAACERAGVGGGAGEWRAQIDTVGDTVIVRTLSGSEWGTARLALELRTGVLEGAEHEMFGEIAGLAW